MTLRIGSAFISVTLFLFTACGGEPPPATLNQAETPIEAPVEAQPSATNEAPPVPEATPPVATPAPAPPAANDGPLSGSKTLLDEGRQASADGDLTTAEARLKDVILRTVGTDAASARIIAEARYNLGVLSEWKGNDREARRNYEAALIAQPEFGTAVIAMGRLMLRGGDVEGALNYALGRMVGKKDSIPLRNALNRLRLDAERDFSAVETDSKKILRTDEKNVDAMMNLAVVYHRAGKYELAIAVLSNAKVLDGDDPEIFYRIALAHAALKEDIQARLVLEEATLLPGGATAEVYNNLGLMYHRAGDYVAAEIEFRKALAKWPTMLPAQVNLANSLKGQQRYEDARIALESAKEAYPTSADVFFNLGILYLDGQFPGMQALPRLESALVFFERYKELRGQVDESDPVDDYIAEAGKRIVVEKKRAEQMSRRTKAPEPEEAEPADAAPAPTPLDEASAPAEPAVDTKSGEETPAPASSGESAQ